MRYNLVTQIVCAVCNEVLELQYKSDSGSTEGKYSLQKRDKDVPTGAYAREMYIHVKPCVTCMQPAKDAKQALEVLRNL